MRDEPPQHLVSLLARLHLATAEQVQAVQPRARQLAHGMPLVESLWVDALAKAGRLTPFQANEINSGRGEQLLVGPYVVQKRLQSLANATGFLAVEIESKRMVHLFVERVVADVKLLSGRQANDLANVRAVIDRCRETELPEIAKPENSGSSNDCFWVAYEPSVGFPLIDWVSTQGRLPPAAALEVARQCAAAMASAEMAKATHGDLSVASIWLTDDGTVQITRLAFASLDEKSKPPRVDTRAFGQFIWHLLTGRAPLAHGELPDVKFIAPDAPAELIELIKRCMGHDSDSSPPSFNELCTTLGPPTAVGRRQLVAALMRSRRATLQVAWRERARLTSEQFGGAALAAAACVLLLAAATSPLWRVRHESSAALAAAQLATNKSQTAASITQAAPAKSAVKPASVAVQKPDSEVQPASYQAELKRKPERAEPPPAKVIELPGGAETNAAAIRLQPGVIVRGSVAAQGGEESRSRVVVPSNGFVVNFDRTRFENIDFIWRFKPNEIMTPEAHSIIDLRAAQIQFVNCTFQATSAGSFELPAAIRVSSKSKSASTLAPAAHVQAERCVFRNLACGVQMNSRGPAAISLRNCLYMGKGSVVRFPEFVPADAAATVSLESVTIRGANSIVNLNCDSLGEPTGAVTVSAVGCVFQTEENGALVTVRSSRNPISADGILRAIEWSGQGSLVTPGTRIAIWQHGDIQEPLPEADLPFEGLATSELKFAGEPSEDPATSRLTRWLGPVKSDQMPGIAVDLPRVPALRSE